MANAVAKAKSAELSTEGVLERRQRSIFETAMANAVAKAKSAELSTDVLDDIFDSRGWCIL